MGGARARSSRSSSVFVLYLAHIMGDVDAQRRPTLLPLHSRDWHDQERQVPGEASSSETSDAIISHAELLALDGFLCFLTWCKLYVLHKVHIISAARNNQPAKLRLVSLSRFARSARSALASAD